VKKFYFAAIAAAALAIAACDNSPMEEATTDVPVAGPPSPVATIDADAAPTTTPVVEPAPEAAAQ